MGGGRANEGRAAREGRLPGAVHVWGLGGGRRPPRRGHTVRARAVKEAQALRRHSGSPLPFGHASPADGPVRLLVHCTDIGRAPAQGPPAAAPGQAERATARRSGRRVPRSVREEGASRGILDSRPAASTTAPIPAQGPACPRSRRAAPVRRAHGAAPSDSASRPRVIRSSRATRLGQSSLLGSCDPPTRRMAPSLNLSRFKHLTPPAAGEPLS